MRYDIIINLDYGNYPHDQLKQFFSRFQRLMMEKGFVMDGRRFTIDQSPAQAQELAREVIDALEQHYGEQGESVYPWIKEFFGFEPENASNLLVPPAEEIDVEELADLDGLDVDLFFRHAER